MQVGTEQVNKISLVVAFVMLIAICCTQVVLLTLSSVGDRLESIIGEISEFIYVILIVLGLVVPFCILFLGVFLIVYLLIKASKAHHPRDICTSRPLIILSYVLMLYFFIQLFNFAFYNYIDYAVYSYIADEQKGTLAADILQVAWAVSLVLSLHVANRPQPVTTNETQGAAW